MTRSSPDSAGPARAAGAGRPWTRRGPARTRVVRFLDWGLPPAGIGEREVLVHEPAAATGRPPLLFVHGLAHGAWAFAEHWLPAAAERGFTAAAVSLRGHGASGGNGGRRLSLLRDFVHDVLQAVVELPGVPVLVGHAMGSLVVQHVLDRYPARAAVLVTPVPPDHGLDVVAHLAVHNPAGLARALAGRTLRFRGRDLFSAELPEATAAAHVARLGEESPLAQLQLALPRRPRPTMAPVLVLGTPDDEVIPRSAVARTAHHYATTPHWFPGMGHDLMLDARWRQPLDVLLDWVDATVPPRPPT